MKRKITVSCRCTLIIFFLLSASLRLFGQSVTNYTFTSTTLGSFVPMTGGSTATWVGSTDDGATELIPIGFDFWYMGTRYTTLSATTNGWMLLGAIPTEYGFTNNLSSAGATGAVIAPLWDDLDIANTANVTYKTTGTAGSRVFTLQYLNVKWDYMAIGAVCSFKVNLYETTGKVEFVYGSNAYEANLPSASIGIAALATGAGNYLSVNNEGTAASSAIESIITTKRAAGTTYGFTPAQPTAPGSLSFSALTATAVTLNWTDLSNNETGFVIYRSTDGVNYTFASQTVPNATSSTQSGLTTGTTYYWRVYAVTEGALSNALSGTQATSCAGPVISLLPATGLISYYKFEGNTTDAAGNNTGTFQGGAPAPSADRFTIAGKAYTFNGSSNYITTTNSYVNPSAVSVSSWFKTTSTTGGVLMGFSSQQTGTGGNRSRFIYMSNAGALYFGVAPGGVKKYVNTTTAYNDGNWHQVTATLGTGGMRLYVDGELSASDPNVTTAEPTTGYWRLGYSDVSTWPNEPSGYYFKGTLDDMVIYHRELTATEAGTLYNRPDGAGSNSPVCVGTALNLTAAPIAGATYLWTGPNGFTSTQQNPSFTYTAANAGTYTLQVTAPGCALASTAYTNVTSTTVGGRWTGAVSSDWGNAANWCNGVLPTAATDVIIAAGVSNMPVINTAVNCKNLTVNNGTTVTLSGTGTLNIAGTLLNNGIFNNNGTINFNGTTGQQTFTGIASFFNLTASNSNGLLLPAAITINNDLTIASGTLNANNYNISVAGNWVNNTSATAFTAGNASVTFNSTSAKTIGGSFPTTFNNLIVASTNTLSLAINTAIGGNLFVNSGIFNLSTFTANRLTAGGTLTVANNATLKIGGTNTYPVNYATNTLMTAGTVEYAGTNQTITNLNYGNLSLSSAAGAVVKTFPATALTITGNLISTVGTGTLVTFTAAAAITVNGSVVLGASTIFNSGSYTHTISGNWTNNGTFNGNTGTIIFNGSGTTVIGTGIQNFNNLTVAASQVNFSAEGLSLTGNLATTGAGSFTQVSGGTISMTGANTTIAGGAISLDNLTITGSVTSTSSITVTGNLSVSGSFIANGGTITMSGTSKTISGAGTKTFNVLSVSGTVTTAVNFTIASGLVVNGGLTASGGAATFTGSSTLSGLPNLFNVIINGTSLQLSANATLGIAGALTLTAGTLNVSAAPNTVNFNGNNPQSINALTYNNLSFSNTGVKTAAGAINVNNNLTIESGATFTAGNFTHSVYNSWYNAGTFNAGAGTIQFLGNENSAISGATTFNNLTLNRTTAAVRLTLLSNVFVGTVNMTTGNMHTGTNTLTITVTRNGNGIILGTITRNHNFALLTAYAFEGPDNLIVFTVPLGINSVTVSVFDTPATDFPSNGSVRRNYTISVPNGTYVTASIRLHYEDSELNGNAENSMVLWRNTGTGWASSGKTANSTTANYVEQALLLNISGRWTISDNLNIVQWNGSVSSDWNTAANWTAVQGSGARPPSATTIANIGTAAFTNQPVITTAATAKDINFGSVQAINLSLASGGSLVTSEIKGSWSANATHNINVNGQTITVNGDLALSDGIAGHAINLNIGTGTANITNVITQSGNATIAFTGAGSMNIGGDFNYVNGTFTPGSSTVIYNGNMNQNVGGVTYNNLTINKSAANAIAGSSLMVNGILTLTAGEFDSNTTTTITGNVNIASGAIFQNNGTVNVGGNWNNSGTFISNGNNTNVIFNGAGTQNIAATTFNNIEISKPVGTVATLTGNIIIKGNFTGTSGTVDTQSFLFNRDVQGGIATLADSGTLLLAADNALNKFTNYSFGTNSTVIYNGTGTQNLSFPSVAYGNIIFRNFGTKTLAVPVTVKGNLTIESGATFDGGTNTITLNGNWVNNGSYIPSSSTVAFNGSTKSVSGTTTFNKATVAGSYTLLNAVTFNGLLDVTTTGILNGSAGITATINSNLTNSGTLTLLGTSTFTGGVLQTLNFINTTSTTLTTVNFNGSVSPIVNSTLPLQLGYVNINNTGGITANAGWTIANDITIASGASFAGGTSTHILQGTLNNNGTITSSGTFNFIPTTAAILNFGTNFTSIGTVFFGGSGAITLAGNPNSLRDVIVSNINAGGVTSGSNLTVTNNFTINNGSVFNAGSYNYLLGGNFLNNGTLNSATSAFTLNGAGAQDIYSASALYKLTVNKSNGNATISSNITVNNVLTFISGKINTGSYVLVQSVTGTTSGAAQNTGWVYGKLRKNIATGAITKTFEIGNANTYLPVQVAFANVTSSGDLTVFTTEGDHPSVANSLIDPAKSVNRYWTLSNNGIVFTTANATFNYAAADVDAGAATSAFITGQYSNVSWNYPMVSGLTATSLSVSGLNALSDFQIGQLAISIKTWDGGAGTPNWGDAANWNPDGVPTTNDNVELAGPYTINVNVPAVTKNLLLSDANLVLSTVVPNTLSISGNLKLAAGTLNFAGALPAVTGLVDVSAGTVGFTGTGSQTIPAYNYYNLVSSSTGARVLATSGTIGIANSFTPGTNAYTVAGSTVSYNGIGAQTVAASAYNNLLLDNANVKTFAAGTTAIAGNLSVASGVRVNTELNSATVKYNGANDQTVTNITYYNLDVAKPSGIITLLDATVKNAFTTNQGIVSIGNSNDKRKIIVNGDMVIAVGAALSVSSSSDTKHSLNIGGNIISNGLLEMTTDANSLATVNFIKDGNQTLSGSGISKFYEIAVNQGTSNANTLEILTAGFTAPAGFLTVSNGTFKLNNANLSITPFTTDITTGHYLIPANAGLWVNAGTINSPAMTWTVAGLVNVSGGVMNMGNAINNTVIPKSQARFSISGGTLNLASAIGSPESAWRYDMQGGTVNVNIFGNTANGVAPFTMDIPTDVFNVSGGNIIIQNSGGALGQNLGYKNLAATGTGFTGGTLQMGNASTLGTQIMEINTVSPLYNLQISNAGVTIPLINNDLTVHNNVTVAAGTLNINDRLIQIGGAINSNGNFIVSNGTVEMNGSSAQLIAAGAFTDNRIKNLMVTNNAGVNLGGALNLTEILKVNTGTLNTAGHLTLVSTDSKTALIDGSGAGQVTGNVTMQRYLIAGFGYKYFSSPFQNATVSSFASTVDLNASFPNFYNYIENKPSSGFTTYTNPSDLLNPMQGYAADFGPSPVQKTVTMTGIVNNGPLTATLYNHNQPFTRGFNLVGNPYPSPVNWDAGTGWTKTNIDNALYFFNSGSVSQYTGAYSTYINGVSSDGVAGPIIASMQGFFVHVSDGSYPVAGMLGINNNARVNDLSPVFHKSTFRTGAPDIVRPRTLIRLSANFSDNAQSADPLVVYSEEEAPATFDSRFDAMKLMNIDDQLPNLYSISEGASKLVINAISTIDSTMVIPLGIKTERDGRVTFNLRDLENWPPDLHLYLRDAVTGVNHDLQNDPVYTVDLQKGTVENRFSLICTPAVISKDIFIVYGSGDDMHAKIKLVQGQTGELLIHNVMGQVVSTLPVHGNGDYKLQGLAPNMVYIVSFATSAGNHSVKILTANR